MRPGRGHEGERVLRVDAAFDGVAGDRDVALLELETAAVGDADLLAHEIEAGDQFGHRMLDLQPRVHLDEVELAVLVEKLDRADAEITELRSARA